MLGIGWGHELTSDGLTLSRALSSNRDILMSEASAATHLVLGVRDRSGVVCFGYVITVGSPVPMLLLDNATDDIALDVVCFKEACITCCTNMQSDNK